MYYSPMTPHLQLLINDNELFENPKRYRRLVGIVIAASIVSLFMFSPTINHWTMLDQILYYLKGAPR